MNILNLKTGEIVGSFVVRDGNIGVDLDDLAIANLIQKVARTAFAYHDEDQEDMGIITTVEPLSLTAENERQIAHFVNFHAGIPTLAIDTRQDD